jgi:hypothetical protein
MVKHLDSIVIIAGVFFTLAPVLSTHTTMLVARSQASTRVTNKKGVTSM